MTKFIPRILQGFESKRFCNTKGKRESVDWISLLLTASVFVAQTLKGFQTFCLLELESRLRGRQHKTDWHPACSPGITAQFGFRDSNDAIVEKAWRNLRPS